MSRRKTRYENKLRCNLSNIDTRDFACALQYDMVPAATNASRIWVLIDVACLLSPFTVPLNLLLLLDFPRSRTYDERIVFFWGPLQSRSDTVVTHIRDKWL